MHHSSQPDPAMAETLRAFHEKFSDRRENAEAAMERKLQALRSSEYAPKLGATGRFPQGQLTEHDEGEIQFQSGVVDRKVIVDFGQEVVWVGMDAAQARSLARALLKHADHAS
jgi:hypothetical protein